MPANSFSARLKDSFLTMAWATCAGRWQDSRSGRVARNTPSGESNRRSTRADRREARPGVSPSASQEREASSCIEIEPMCRVTDLSSSLRRTENNERSPYRENARSAPRLSRVFLQNGIHCLDEKIRIGFGKNQRRAQLDDVVMWSVRAGENAAIAKAVHHIGSLQRSSLARFTVEHQIDPQEKPRPSHVPYQGIVGLQSLQAPDEMRANAQGALM